MLSYSYAFAKMLVDELPLCSKAKLDPEVKGLPLFMRAVSTMACLCKVTEEIGMGSPLTIYYMSYTQLSVF